MEVTLPTGKHSPKKMLRGILQGPLGIFHRTEDQFAFFFVSFFAAKLLHLYTHILSLPILLYLLYLPTFLSTDVALLAFGKLLFYRRKRCAFGMLRKLLGGLLAMLTAAAAAASISFYMETGGEIQWLAGTAMANDPGGLKMLLSGLPCMALAFGVLALLAYLIAPSFNDVVDHALDAVAGSFKEVFGCSRRSDGADDPEKVAMLVEETNGEDRIRERSAVYPRKLRSLALISALVTVIVLHVVRPTRPPYAHMSGSIPLTVVGALLFNPVDSDFCLPYPREPVEFPFEDFPAFDWEGGSSDFPEWMPRSDYCRSLQTYSPQDNHSHFPNSGANDPSTESHGSSTKKTYDPRCDPLKFTNIKQDVLKSLQDTFRKSKPSIKHVVVLTLESTRKDMFPFKKESDVYKRMISANGPNLDQHDLDRKLKNLTPVAQLLTGESNGFGEDNAIDKKLSSQSWRKAFEGDMGGVNVQGAITAAAYTLKSMLGTHCGVESLPVDFNEEVKGQIYQPCIAQILDLFNSQMNNASAGGQDFLSSQWESVIMQSVTDKFDLQDILDPQMGFKDKVMREQIRDHVGFPPPTGPEVNYFGYPETELIPYMRARFEGAKKDSKRLFISHVTSTTHHPYSTPKDWDGRQDFHSRSRFSRHDPFYDYLNAIKWQDEWIGRVFELLDEQQVLDETLVVLVGDHGMAFHPIDGSSTCYENGHNSNMHIPLLMLHPSLPRVQIAPSETASILSILPTILDLLLQTDSLPDSAAKTAQRLLPNYQGQSLLRHLASLPPSTASSAAPAAPTTSATAITNTNQNNAALFSPANITIPPDFHITTINPGGAILALSSTSLPYRLVMPLCSTTALRFTSTATSALEPAPQIVTGWTSAELRDRVMRAHGPLAARWAEVAEKVGRWWVWESRRRWNYHGVARSTDRGGVEGAKGGRIEKEHWWET
ncbi:alkaline-phosphatase-like protein [Phyllosticta citribraziliensis]|uniref:Alkaline-phosphatase-like protein n=1 Tax=Phyllosticta citribraziliensis TaxID=989973 RepID=A0ABR1M536_9PEZI